MRDYRGVGWGRTRRSVTRIQHLGRGRGRGSFSWGSAEHSFFSY